MAFEKLALDTAKQRARISRPLFMYLVRISSSVIQHNILHIPTTSHNTTLTKHIVILTKPLHSTVSHKIIIFNENLIIM